MTRTSPWRLVLLFVAAAVVMWALQSWITAGGSATLVPSIPFGVTLVVIGAVALALAWPVRRYTQALREANEAHRRDAGRREDTRAEDSAHWRRVDSQRATFALALAKASSLGGSIFAGACAATVLWLASRTVVGAGMPIAVFSLVCAALLLIAGVIAESWCALPPDDGAESASDALPTAG
jgi:uncharacterized membrane protein (DUF485 family)